ncbi:MAG: FAD-dependent oxidoreductase [Defluviitaleaceae bacterium]|nr:FAD-dependent oxidoreductase [Defluviitaleaceae bacterium]
MENLTVKTVMVEINGIGLDVPQGWNILAACRAAGVDIPTLCYDDMVEPYSGCGLCLVEVEGARKLARSCSTLVADGMKVHTETPKVQRARKAQLEMLLADHVGDCLAPCRLACPGDTDAQGYVGLIANGMFEEALTLIMDKIPLPGCIGRVCPHPCEEKCRRQLVEEPISICTLKRFAADACADKDIVPEVGADTGFKVAVVGGGPAGLSAAFFLRKYGHAVTVYEELEKMGGMLRYGIPEYRLPKAVLDAELSVFEKMGVEMVNGVKIGRDITLDTLREKFDRVFVGIGASKSVKLGCPGEELDGVYGGVEFLRSVAEGKLTGIEGTVAVVGGGDTAMDACRTAVRLGAGKVCVIYRRTVDEMPANKHEIKEALEEGVIFKNLRNPNAIVGENGKVSGVRLQVMELGEPDESGRRAPVPVEGEEEELAVDHVIVMIGQTLDLTGFEGISLGRKKTITANGCYETNIPGVYAAGDAINKGPGIAIEAIGQARKAADYINESLLTGSCAEEQEKFLVKSEKTKEDLADKAKLPRECAAILPPEVRKLGFMEAAKGFDAETAQKEASRCLECGCMAYYDCKLLEYSNRYGITDMKLIESRKQRVADIMPEYFTRDMNKCVLCRLCVRVCDEVEGNGAIGAAMRGFDTVILPAMGKPLSETDCTNCGECVAVCPTGALWDKNGRKRVPLPEKKTSSVCGYCGVGCGSEISTYGRMITRIEPDGGLMCSKGRYGYSEDIYKDRIETPMLRRIGRLEKAEFGEAYSYIKEEIGKITAAHGKSSVAVGIHGSLTNEETGAALDYAKKIGAYDAGNVFRTDMDGELAGMPGFLKDAGEFRGSYAGLENADVVILTEGRAAKCGVAKLHIKKAVANGAKLILLSESETFSSNWASVEIGAAEQTGERAESAARLYADAENAVVVLSWPESAEEMDAFAGFLTRAAGLRGQAGRENRVLRLLPEANSKGLNELGIVGGVKELKDKVISGGIKGLVMFGGGAAFGDALKAGEKPEFLAVVDKYMEGAANDADAALPAAVAWETTGTFTNIAGEERKVNAAVAALGGRTTERVIREMA